MSGPHSFPSMWWRHARESLVVELWGGFHSAVVGAGLGGRKVCFYRCSTVVLFPGCVLISPSIIRATTQLHTTPHHTTIHHTTVHKTTIHHSHSSTPPHSTEHNSATNNFTQHNCSPRTQINKIIYLTTLHHITPHKKPIYHKTRHTKTLHKTPQFKATQQYTTQPYITIFYTQLFQPLGELGSCYNGKWFSSHRFGFRSSGKLKFGLSNHMT